MKGAPLARAAGEVFAGTLLFQSAPEAARPDAATLRSQLMGLLDAFSRSAAAGQAPDEVEEARFALVAWIDEVVSVSGWAGAEEWMREPLQLQVFGTRQAGVEFYSRLENLRPENAAALEVYFDCLALGFQGSYAGRDGDRQAIVQRTLDKLRRVERALDLGREKRVTPTAYKVDITLSGRSGRLLPMLLGGMGGLLLLFGLLWGVLFLRAGGVPPLIGS
jgi:type IV/VI secretion system ImpK/VasF family protein